MPEAVELRKSALRGARLRWVWLAVTLLFGGAATGNQEFSATPETADQDRTLPQLRVDGRHVVGPDGKPVRLRGLALSDPHHLSEQGQWTRRYFEEAASWGANLVRIPVHPARWREVGAEQYFEWLDEGVAWAAELGLYVIIDWHTIGNPLTGVPHRPMYLTTREETFYFWHLVGFRYAGNEVDHEQREQRQEVPVPETALLPPDDLGQVQATRHHQHADQRKAHGQLVGDDLRSRTHGAQKRIL